MDYAVAAAPARVALEQRRWADAAALVPLASTFPRPLPVTHYVRALGAARSGAIDAAQKDVDKLTELRRYARRRESKTTGPSKSKYNGRRRTRG